MIIFRSRSARRPLCLRPDNLDADLPCVDDIVAAERPVDPVHCLRPATIAAAAKSFVEAFPGDVLFAVKSNPEPTTLRAVWAGGVKHFDCASLPEIALVRGMFPEAGLHFMHPVKSRPAIAQAYAAYGVRDFALDSRDELIKILAEVEPLRCLRPSLELGLVVRLAVATCGAVYDLTGKFGAPVGKTAALLREARPYATRLGVSFHVGSQCLEPLAFARALKLARKAIDMAGISVDVIDVGGGFPVSYADATPPPLGCYFSEIEAALEKLRLPASIRLWAEPGRVLVASGGSVVAQVQLRRDRALYINDGVYGSLSDAGRPGFRFPVRLIRPENPARCAELEGFTLFGPTCDSADRMEGPFLLPADVREGDWIEIGQLGAYGACLSTAFNGFEKARLVEVCDPPLLAA